MNKTPDHTLPFRRAPLRQAEGLEQAKRAGTEGPELAEGQRTVATANSAAEQTERPSLNLEAFGRSNE